MTSPSRVLDHDAAGRPPGARALAAVAADSSPAALAPAAGPGQRPPGVEIVIPVRNEEKDLARSVHRLHAYLAGFPFRTQITIADNGTGAPGTGGTTGSASSGSTSQGGPPGSSGGTGTPPGRGSGVSGAGRTGSGGTGPGSTGSGGTAAAGPGSSAGRRGGMQGGWASGPGGGLGGSTTVSKALTSLLVRGAAGYRWAAATVGSESAAPLQLAAREPVMSIGGFTGTDPAPSLAQFEKLVTAHEIHYFVGTNADSFGGGSGAAEQITAWVKAHFKSQTVGGLTVCNLSSPRTAS